MQNSAYVKYRKVAFFVFTICFTFFIKNNSYCHIKITNCEIDSLIRNGIWIVCKSNAKGNIGSCDDSVFFFTKSLNVKNGKKNKILEFSFKKLEYVLNPITDNIELKLSSCNLNFKIFNFNSVQNNHFIVYLSDEKGKRKERLTIINNSSFIVYEPKIKNLFANPRHFIYFKKVVAPIEVQKVINEMASPK